MSLRRCTRCVTCGIYVLVGLNIWMSLTILDSARAWLLTPPVAPPQPQPPPHWLVRQALAQTSPAPTSGPALARVLPARVRIVPAHLPMPSSNPGGSRTVLISSPTSSANPVSIANPVSRQSALVQPRILSGNPLPPTTTLSPQSTLDPRDLSVCRSWQHESSQDYPGFGSIPAWQAKLRHSHSLGYTDPDGNVTEYCLTVIAMVRIYPGDPAAWSVCELKQWLHYLYLAGVEHVYLCDHYAADAERLGQRLDHYTSQGVVTYIPWGVSENRSQHSVKARDDCYRHVVGRYGSLSRWQMTLDIDEYPFSAVDSGEGFLTRAVHSHSGVYGAALSELTLVTRLMHGQGDRRHYNLTLARITRLDTAGTGKPLPHQLKPLYRPDRVDTALDGQQVSQLDLEKGVQSIQLRQYRVGRSVQASDEVLYLLRYWGAKLQDWGPDTPEMMSHTREFTAMRSAHAEKVRQSLLAFGEVNAFSNTTGP